MRVRILKPSKNAMQSGRAGASRKWMIQPVLETARRPEEVMGWVSAEDTLSGLNGKLSFDSYEAASRFAAKKGWQVEEVPAHERKVTPRSYIDIFKPRTLSSAG